MSRFTISRHLITTLVAGTLASTWMVWAAQAPEPTQSTWDGIYTGEQAQRGQPLYKKECASCHGDLMGGGEMSPPLTGGEFLANWNGLTVGDLFERIRTTMPISKPKSLSRQANSDILAYIFRMGKFPAGKDELPPDAELLKQIRIDAEKPEPKPKP
ncbi:MAG: cytochrome c [Acidobacteria bacterium]|nr:cytochrome c [Acidobacteriota bacterium]